jgi:hypothetical protein
MTACALWAACALFPYSRVIVVVHWLVRCKLWPKTETYALLVGLAGEPMFQGKSELDQIKKIFALLGTPTQVKTDC